jgi:EAL domain-containing protein (putative c-di-GMP-specific phosphodiesterase class I)
MLQEPTRSSDVMQQQRRLGVALSADDFGVGYSSLARLVQPPLSELKIDMGPVLDARVVARLGRPASHRRSRH